ncbi:MAG: hypothetical protein DMD63_04635 [Gemmatimonadetes bacterium]|nr:MAG: hypothetical protein DMD63_04635 [Gemmatimonadota bacterium]
MIGSAPNTGITTAFITSLNTTPTTLAIATLRIQLRGRTYPMSGHGVCDPCAHTSTSTPMMAPIIRASLAWLA